MKRDVIVIGGGPAGFGAAVAAAKMGADVLLLEQANRLGGTGVQGLVPMIRTAGDNGGVIREYWRRLEKNHGVVMTDTHAFVNPSVGGLTALDMTLEAGAKVLFHVFAEGVKRRGRVVSPKSHERVTRDERFFRKSPRSPVATPSGDVTLIVRWEVFKAYP